MRAAHLMHQTGADLIGGFDVLAVEVLAVGTLLKNHASPRR